jgi:small-conductance mechanosensitive channel
MKDSMIDARLAALWNDSAQWLTANWGRIIVAAVIAGLIVALLLGLKWFGRRLSKNYVSSNHWRRIVGSALAKTRLWFIVAVAAQVVATYSHAPYDLARTIYFLFVIAATLQAAVFVREIILGLIEYRAHGHEALGSAIHVIRLLVTFALFSVAVVLILSNLGVNVTGLITGLGIGGIAIGLAAQGIFKDLFAALAILFDRPFGVTDLIKFGDVTGRVESIGLKTTRIRALDGEEVIMSNDKLLDQQIRNFHGIAQRRITLTLPLHYANAAAKFEGLPQALEGVVAQIPDSRFVHALLTSFEPNAIMFELMLHSTAGEADVRDRVRHQAMCATLAYLEAEGIGLSYQATDTPGSQADVVERK